MKKGQNLYGFSMVELMISLALGAVLSLAVVQVMVSNRVTNQLNQTVSEVQESGRFVMSRMRNELLEAGLYDTLSGNIALGADIVSESAFVQNHPVGLTNDFPADANLSSLNGASGASDTLVINLLAEQDCAGGRYGYPNGQSFHVTNQYFVTGDELRCQGYNGRVLRNQANTAISSGTVTLMDGVVSFQIQYGISAPGPVSDGSAVRYVTANELPLVQAAGQVVVALRMAILMESSGSLSGLDGRTFTVLDVQNVAPTASHYGQVFTYTIALRNMKNFVRGTS